MYIGQIILFTKTLTSVDLDFYDFYRQAAAHLARRLRRNLHSLQSAAFFGSLLGDPIKLGKDREVSLQNF